MITNISTAGEFAMTNTSILFAENDADFLETWCEFLEKEGYRVIPALDAREAMAILEKRQIDVAVIDIRLINDDDEKDFSGLELAKRAAPEVRKIILTRFPEYNATREALGTQLHGLPAAVDFVAKQDGPQSLLTAIRKALKLPNRYYAGLDALSRQIRNDYEDARQQAKVNYWGSFVVSAIGILIIFVGVGLAMANQQLIGFTSTLAGVVVQAIGLLFFKRADLANGRMDKYHRELLETRHFDNLLAACEVLLIADRQEECIQQVIAAGTNSWLPQYKRAENEDQVAAS
jgi:CheY-like chemotaxis protein